MKKSISILTAFIMVVTMMFSNAAIVTAAEDTARETAISCTSKEEMPAEISEAAGYATQKAGRASTIMQTCTVSVEREFDFAYEVLDLVNQERAKEGLPALNMDKNLLDAAMLRAAENAVFYDHIRPNGLTCYTADTSSPQNMHSENIAAGFRSPELVMNAWMNSSGHRTNILRAESKSIGIGVVYHNGYYYWVQCFGMYSGNSDFEKPVNDVVKQEIEFISQISNTKGTYYLTPELEVPTDTLEPGQTTKVRLKMLNAGFTYAYAIINNICVTYSAENDCIKVDPDGTVTAVKGGTANVNATIGGPVYSHLITVLSSAVVAKGNCGISGDNVKWALDSDGVLIISGTGAMKNYNPNTGPFVPWTGKTVTKVIVKDGVTSIGDNAFRDFNKIAEVQLPEGLVSIGNQAFSSCSGFTEIKIPSTVESIGANAFRWCSNLKAVEIPADVTSIEEGVFYGCTNLASVKLPEGLGSIGKDAFYDCKELAEITILDGVTSLGQNCIYVSTTIRGYAGSAAHDYAKANFLEFVCISHIFGPWEITTHATLTEPGIVTRVCEGCGAKETKETNLVARGECGAEGGNVTWTLTPDGSLRISGEGAMEDFASAGPWKEFFVASITVNDGVTSIGSFAFSGCSDVTEVDLPDGITKINDSAFAGCSGLEEIEIPETVKTIGASAFAGCSSLGNAVLPEGLEALGASAFDGCSSLMNVSIPSTLAEIADAAFRGCDLMVITIPDTVKAIGEAAIDQTTKIHANGETAAYEYAKANNNPFECIKHVFGAWKILIPPTADEVGREIRECIYCDAFEGRETHFAAKGECGAEGGNLTWELTPDGVLRILGEGEMADYYPSEIPWRDYEVTFVIIENGVTSIGVNAFNGCADIESVVLPESLKSIGVNSFNGCTGLKEIEIPYGVTAIGSNAFQGCKSLTDVTIPASVKEIGAAAFSACSGLKTVTIEEGVEKIHEMAFVQCGNLQTVTIPDSVTYIGSDAIVEPTAIRGNGASAASLYAKANMLEFECIDHKATLTHVPAVPAECGKAGTIEYWDCEFCENSYKDEDGKIEVKNLVDPAKEHQFTVYVLNNDSTCTEDGTETAQCDNCNKTDTRVAKESMLGHNIVIDKAVAATCEKTGLTAGQHCTRCDKATVKQEVVPALGHEYEGKVTKAATCDAEGVKTFTCKNNAKHSYTEAVPAKGHDIVVDKAVAATCEKTGLTEGQHCTRCNDKTIKQNVVPALGHKYDAGVVTKEPTTKEEGIKTFTCINCKDTYTEPIAKLEEPETPAATNGVTRIFGAGRYETAIQSANVLKEELGVSKFDTIIVASGKTFADALPGSYLAAKNNAPILLISAGKASMVRDYIKANLVPGGKVYVLGGEAAVASSWMNGISYERLGGASRYETNLMILKAAGVEDNAEIMVCTGKNFADSLSVSATGKPILMVNKSLNASQKAFLNSIQGEKYFVIGGEAAVTKAVESECRALGTTKRVAGDNRYTTSISVAEEFFAAPEYAVLAFAQNFPDGLSAGPLAYTIKAPLILTQTGKEGSAAAYTKSKGIEAGFVLGGPTLISDDAVRKVFGMSNADVITVK